MPIESQVCVYFFTLAGYTTIDLDSWTGSITLKALSLPRTESASLSMLLQTGKQK